jgi:hypothetical protein
LLNRYLSSQLPIDPTPSVAENEPMPTWGELLRRLQQLHGQGRRDAVDVVRREALAALADYTGRNAVLYASGHLQKPRVAPELLSITNEDIEGFMEVFHGLSGTSIDLILHSPGGRAEATEAIVNYIRSKFKDVRVIIPHEAMSAATMLACAADRIVMGRESYLGPIDPQFQLSTPLGLQSVPARAILDQFARAKKEYHDDRANLAVWIPSLQQYGPALLEQCEHALALAQELVSDWLDRWMLRRSRKRKERSKEIAAALAKHKQWRTHARPIGPRFLKSLGMKIDLLEADQQLQDKVLTVYHAAMHTFSATPATKIIENHDGRAFIKLHQEIVVQAPQPPRGTPPTQPRQPDQT